MAEIQEGSKVARAEVSELESLRRERDDWRLRQQRTAHSVESLQVQLDNLRARHVDAVVLLEAGHLTRALHALIGTLDHPALAEAITKHEVRR